MKKSIIYALAGILLFPNYANTLSIPYYKSNQRIREIFLYPEGMPMPSLPSFEDGDLEIKIQIPLPKEIPIPKNPRRKPISTKELLE
jgi:hypothetical protein